MALMKERPKPQVDKFRKLARELECDDDDEAFKAKVAKVLNAPKPVSREEEGSG